MYRLSPVPVIGVVLAAAGCAGPNRPIRPPSYSADAMADAALAAYDRDGNGVLNDPELDACPGLKPLAGKGRGLTRDRLVERFNSYQTSGVGSTQVACTVRLNGKPLAAADVTFTPEGFMPDGVSGAAGTSAADGSVRLTRTDGVPGLACGVYKIAVSKKGADGTEQLPARYNAQTTLGWEVHPDPRATRQVDLDLKTP